MLSLTGRHFLKVQVKGGPLTPAPGGDSLGCWKGKGGVCASPDVAELDRPRNAFSSKFWEPSSLRNGRRG